MVTITWAVPCVPQSYDFLCDTDDKKFEWRELVVLYATVYNELKDKTTSKMAAKIGERKGVLKAILHELKYYIEQIDRTGELDYEDRLQGVLFLVKKRDDEIAITCNTDKGAAVGGLLSAIVMPSLAAACLAVHN